MNTVTGVRSLARSLFQLLGRFGQMPRRLASLSRKIFGEITVDRIGSIELVPASLVRVNSHTSGFEQERYKWPVDTIHTPFDSERRFLQGAFCYAYVTQAVIAGDGRVFDSDGRFVRDSAASHIAKVINPGPLKPKVSRSVDGPVLNLNWWSGSENIFHWNRDVLSRAFVLRHLERNSITLLVPETCAEYQTHAVHQLRRAFPACRVEPLAFGEWVRVEECLVPSQAPYYIGSGYLHSEVASFVREVNIAGIATNGATIPVAYVTRANSKHRRIRNEEKLLESLREVVDIEVLSLESYSYKEQMSLMQRVDVLVGVFGAGLTHAYFTRGGGLIEVHNGDSRETHFLTLALSMGIPYEQVIGGPSDVHQDFEIDESTCLATVTALRRMTSL